VCVCVCVCVCVVCVSSSPPPPLSLPPSRAHSLSPSLALSPSHTHTRLHSLSLSRSFSLISSLCRKCTSWQNPYGRSCHITSQTSWSHTTHLATPKLFQVLVFVDLTCSYVWNSLCFMCEMTPCVRGLVRMFVHTCEVTCVKWLIYTCEVTCRPVCSWTWLVRMFDIAYCVCVNAWYYTSIHSSFCMCDMTHSYMWSDVSACTFHIAHFPCVKWLMHTCEVTCRPFRLT